MCPEEIGIKIMAETHNSFQKELGPANMAKAKANNRLGHRPALGANRGETCASKVCNKDGLSLANWATKVS